MKSNRNKRVALYARFSSNNQREESIDAQVRAMTEYCKRNHYQIVSTYVDSAKSATSDNRPEFLNMIADSDKRIFDVLLVHKLDRFARNRYDSAVYKAKLKRNGVQVYSVLERLDDSPESVILESLLEGMNEYYSKNLSREVKKGLKENALSARHTGGKPPLGYDIDTNGKLVINNDEAEVVRLIFNMYDKGYGYSEIMKRLEINGYRTKTGNHFVKSSIHCLLKNEKYKGVFIYNKQNPRLGSVNYGKENETIRVSNGCPQIVSKDLFESVQQKMKLNRYNGGGNGADRLYIFSKVMTCGECGKSMNGNTRYSGRSKLQYSTYRCSSVKTLCDNKEINRDYVDRYVIALLEKYIFNEEAITILTEKIKKYYSANRRKNEKELKELSERLVDITESIENIINAIEVTRGSQVLVEKLDALEQEKALLKHDILEKTDFLTNIKKEVNANKILNTYNNLKKSNSICEFRDFVTSSIDVITVYKYYVVIRIKTGLGVADIFDMDVNVKRKEIYDFSQAIVMAV